MVYQRVVRRALFRMGGGDAEVAHERTLRMTARLAGAAPVVAGLRRYFGGSASRTVFGVRFPGPVGLAAGMDKDGRALKAWPAFGFGFVEVGTVTRHAQPGNPRPRLFRLPHSEGVINRMGFNNGGASALADRLAALGPLTVPLGISIGKSKVTPVDEAVEDYRSSLAVLEPFADYFAVNVSSPNTPGLRGLQDKGALDALLGALDTAVPLLVKIAPDLSEHAIGDVLEVCAAHGVAGLVATNTTLSRDGIAAADSGTAGEAGGLSGRPLTGRALEVVTFVAKESSLPVIGVGGIHSADDAMRMLDAGASLVQVYTGFIYRGPALVRAINRQDSARVGQLP